MSSTLLVWLFVAALIAVAAMFVFPLLPDVRRQALLAWLHSPGRAMWRGGSVTVAAAVLLVVAGIGTAVSYLKVSPEASRSRQHSGSGNAMMDDLRDYARSLGGGEHAPATGPVADKPLPDVETMIERLAARLQTAPEDKNGWRTLGWSYFNTGRYKQAAEAYGRALELDPNVAEVKAAYEKALAKASGNDDVATAAYTQAPVAGKGAEAGDAGGDAKPGAAPPHEYGAAVRAMVDGLAARLKQSPRDLEGWTRLMRSRIVLGEREVAAAAFRSALEVFKDDAAASGTIAAAAAELGLKTE